MKKLFLVIVAVLWSCHLKAEDSPTITSIQYWIDNDRTSTINESNQEFDVDCSSLPTGLHLLHYRAKDSNGRFSQLYEYGFFKSPKEIKADSVLSLQWWIDNDSIAKIENSTEFAIDCTALHDGMHLLHCRIKDSADRYSQLYEYGFLKIAENAKADSIQSLQYWWDDLKDNAVTAPYTSQEFTLSTNALPYGLHSLRYRVQDNVGRWSELRSHYFYKGEVLDSALIVKYSYW